jgi:hypothetical protein
MARLERWLIMLIVLHTFGVGIVLLGAPQWAARFFGWGEVTPLFFPRQAGVFHFVLAIGYLREYFRWRSVALLVTAKSMAFLFLVSTAVLDGSPWVVPFSGVADGLMGLVAYVMHRKNA